MAILESIAFGLAAMLCWGITDFLGAVGSKKIGVFKTLFWGGASGLAVLLLASFTQGSFPIPNFSAFLLILIFGLLAMIGIFSYYKAFSVNKASIVAAVSAIYPIITVFIGILIFAESISFIQGVSIGLMILGVILTSLNLKKISFKSAANIEKGLGFALFAAFIFGILFALFDILVNEFGAFFATLYVQVSTVFLYFVYLAAKRENIAIKNKSEIYIFSAIGLFNMAAFVAVAKGFEIGLVSIVTPVSSLYPAVIIILSWLFLKERLALNQIIGIIGILIGLFLLAS